MMEKKTIGYGALGGVGLILLTLFGANLFDGTHYYCAEKNLSMQCDRFSGTGVRCYPQPIITSGYKDCSQGWSLIVQERISLNTSTLSYNCNIHECVRQ